MAQRASPVKLPVVLLSDFTIGVFERLLRHDQAVPAVEVVVVPPEQLVPELVEGAARPDHVAVVWARAESVLASVRDAVVGGAPILDEAVARDVDLFTDMVARLADRHRHVLVASFVVPPAHRGVGLLEWQPGVGVARAVARANLRLSDGLSSRGDVHVLDADAWIRAAGSTAASPKQWYAAKVPFSNAVFDAAVADVKSALAVLLGGRQRKLVVVDLDDTLWGGTVGEIGWEALRLGGHDHVGEAFQDFQSALKALTRRGVLVAVVSKNTEAVALEALQRHPDMHLRPDDLAGWRINWDDKAANLAELVDELNLGMDSVVFIDDNPAERARVREAFPEVLVPDWPSDPASYATNLRALRCFDTSEVTAEDRQRSTSYAQERERRNAATSLTSFDDWLAALDVRVTAADVDDASRPRAAQLLNKTNQMNLATRRLTETELHAWSRKGRRAVVAFTVEDRFGSSGLTGLLSLEVGDDARAVAVDFLLSCRVMGRRVEQAMLHVASTRAIAMGAREVVFQYRQTPRNAPCLDMLRASSLVEREPCLFIWPLDDGRPYPMPDLIRLSGRAASRSCGER